MIPESQDAETEAVTVASVIGLLWQMRNLDDKVTNQRQRQGSLASSKSKEKKSIFGKVFGKK